VETGLSIRDRVEIDARVGMVRKNKTGPTGSAKPSANALALVQQGLNFHQQGQLDLAQDCYESALREAPRHAETIQLLGIVHYQRKDLPRAAEFIGQALALEPDQPVYLCNLGLVLREQGQLGRAIESYERAIALRPGYALAHSNRGAALQEQGQLDEAMVSYANAIRSAPNFSEAHCNLGAALQEAGQLHAALASYERALQIDPGYARAHTFKASVLLRLGDYQEGWALYEWRLKAADLALAQRHFVRPRWSGVEPVVGKTLLLHAEQGLGDTIQFCRYAKLLTDQGAQVVLQVQPALQELLSGLAGVSAVVPQKTPLPRYDYHCPLMSLPLAFKTTVATIPSPGKYLWADPTRVVQWGALLGPRRRPRVGLVWAGGLRPDQADLRATNARRNIALSEFGLLADLDCEFFSLQKGHAAEQELLALQASQWSGASKIANHTERLVDFADTAALIENLDLVISVDTSTAHLTAALGKPVWLLNRFDSCWRWLRDRSDSPWYESMRIYRQPEIGNWTAVMTQVAADLGRFNQKFGQTFG